MFPVLLKIAVYPVFYGSGLSHIENVSGGPLHPVNAGCIGKHRPHLWIHGIRPLRLAGIGLSLQPIGERFDGPDAAPCLEPFHCMLPDHTGCCDMFPGPPFFPDRMTEIPRHSPQPFSGQFGNQVSNNLMGAKDI